MYVIVLVSSLLSMILAQFGVQKNLFPPIMEPAMARPGAASVSWGGPVHDAEGEWPHG